VALDRQSIARRDFPAARRGYDQGAVDRHLAAIADEVEELRRRTAPGAVLAGQTSEQVRTIIEAAEASAAGIRASATAEARGHVAHVVEAADALRQRIAALDSELTEVLGALRAGAERIHADLAGLGAGTSGPAAARVPSPAGVPPVAASALGATVGAATAAAPEPEEVGEEPALAAVQEAAAAAPAGAAPPPPADTAPGAPGTDAAAPVGRSTDEAGARIVALQWAMDGKTRAETDAYLAAHYDLPDRAALLEHVYTIAPNG
jgi:DivIVA domain-containing protein